MTIEQIQEAIKANPELESGIVSLIPNLDKGKELLENHAKAHFDKNIGEKVAEIYTGIDNDIFDVLGVRKNPDQKTYDFLKKDVLSELKKLKEKQPSDDEKATKIKELESRVKSLTEGGADGKFWKETHENAVKAWEEKERKYQQDLGQKEKENLKFVVSNDLTMGLSGLEFNPNVPKSAIDALVDTVKGQVIASSKIDESGKVVYLKEDGTPWLNNEFKPISAKGIFEEKLGDVLKKASTSGGGAQEGVSGLVPVEGGDKSTKKVALDPTTFDSKLGFQTEIEKVLLKEGIERGSKEWNELSNQAYQDYKVAEMKRQ